jgi:hypothetical protein
VTFFAFWGCVARITQGQRSLSRSRQEKGNCIPKIAAKHQWNSRESASKNVSQPNKSSQMRPHITRICVIKILWVTHKVSNCHFHYEWQLLTVISPYCLQQLPTVSEDNNIIWSKLSYTDLYKHVVRPLPDTHPGISASEPVIIQQDGTIRNPYAEHWVRQQKDKIWQQLHNFCMKEIKGATSQKPETTDYLEVQH